MFFKLLCQSLLIGVFRPFAFNKIIDVLVLKSAILFFVFCSFWFLFLCFLFPGYLNIFKTSKELDMTEQLNNNNK